MKSFLVIGLLLTGLTACADNVADFQLTINNPQDPEILDLLYEASDANSNLLEFRKDMSVRFWWTFRGLATNTGQSGIVFSPVQAQFTVTPSSDGSFVPNWHKAAGSGFALFGNKLVARNVPVNKEDFEMVVEFIRSVSVPDLGTQHYVVAWGCLAGPIEQPFTRSQMQSAFSSGINIWAGRSCGSCPAFEGTFSASHNSCFTTDQIDNGNLPRTCGRYDSNPPICTDS